MRMLHNGSAPSFQVGGAGSIPVIRSRNIGLNNLYKIVTTETYSAACGVQSVQTEERLTG